MSGVFSQSSVFVYQGVMFDISGVFNQIFITEKLFDASYVLIIFREYFLHSVRHIILRKLQESEYFFIGYSKHQEEPNLGKFFWG
jgi:hypothetical protein